MTRADPIQPFDAVAITAGAPGREHQRVRVFLPYAYRERPPLDRDWVCAVLRRVLEDIAVETEIDARRGARMGIMVTAADCADRPLLVSRLLPHLPEGMFDTGDTLARCPSPVVAQGAPRGGSEEDREGMGLRRPR